MAVIPANIYSKEYPPSKTHEIFSITHFQYLENFRMIYLQLFLYSQSNLADIFDADRRSNDSGSSLKYIPPKPAPTKQSNERAAWSVVIAKIVTAFKL